MKAKPRIENNNLKARRAASALAIALGRSPFERGNRRLTADLLAATPATPASKPVKNDDHDAHLPQVTIVPASRRAATLS